MTPDADPNPEERCRLWLQHVREVIADGKPDVAEWLFDLFADMVQNPGRKSGVALALRSNLQGAGKGVCVQALMRIFGHHAIQLDSTEQLTGSFNFHLAGMILVFADEAVWAAAKRDLGRLLALITEPTVFINPKGVNGYRIPNVTHLIAATNKDHSAPMGLGDRRWVPLAINEGRKGDLDYFRQVTDELNNGGAEALLAYLLARHIERDLRIPPKGADAERGRQQEESLLPLEKYLLDCLMRGTPTTEGTYGMPKEYYGQWKDFISTTWWYRHFRETVGRAADGTSERVFVQKLKTLLGLEAGRKRSGSENRRGVWLPSLAESRHQFVTRLQLSITWGDDGAEDGPVAETSESSLSAEELLALLR